MSEAQLLWLAIDRPNSPSLCSLQIHSSYVRWHLNMPSVLSQASKKHHYHGYLYSIHLFCSEVDSSKVRLKYSPLVLELCINLFTSSLGHKDKYFNGIILNLCWYIALLGAAPVLILGGCRISEVAPYNTKLNTTRALVDREKKDHDPVLDHLMQRFILRY